MNSSERTSKYHHRVTAADIARTAGVSTATVDRVLNGRLPVRPQTATRVLAAAEALGYHMTTVIRQRLSQGRLRLGFVLQRKGSAFYERLADALRQAAEQVGGDRVALEIVYVASQKPAEVAGALQKLAKTCRCIAVVAIDHPVITNAVSELVAARIAVMTLFTDSAMAVRTSYLGVDNRVAGRTAGWLMARTVSAPGKVAVFVGSHRFLGHDMREMGFRSYFRDENPRFDLVETFFNLEDSDLAEDAMEVLLRRHPDLKGIYVTGGGTDGVMNALEAAGKTGEISVICSEATALTRALLAEGAISAILSTPLELMTRTLLDLMSRASEDDGVDALPPQHVFPLVISTPENPH